MRALRRAVLSALVVLSLAAFGAAHVIFMAYALCRFQFRPLAFGLAMVLAARLLLHYFQLESYQFHGYFKTVLRQWRRAAELSRPLPEPPFPLPP